jgi:hypothetical protein
MTTLVTRRIHQLADTLSELKVKLRAALATELAGAVGTAIRDVLVVTLLDRLVTASRPSYPSARSGNWRADKYGRECDPWGDKEDSWTDDDSARVPVSAHHDRNERDEGKSSPAVPAAAAVAVGANIGRWWLGRKGSVAAAVGLGLLTTALGLAGGPIARAILAVLAAASDVLTAESILARADST